jgi:hypothetical protein
MPVGLLLTKFFECFNFPIGFDQRLPPPLDFHFHGLPLFIGGLPLRLEGHFISFRIEQLIDVDGSRPTGNFTMVAQLGKLIVQLSDPAADNIFRPSGNRQLLPTLVAQIFAQAKQRR